MPEAIPGVNGGRFIRVTIIDGEHVLVFEKVAVVLHPEDLTKVRTALGRHIN